MKGFVRTGILVFAMVNAAMAQEQLTIKQQADKLFERYEYFTSLNLYLKLANKKKPDVVVVERVADCYRNLNRYNDAEKWYSKALTDAKAEQTDHYYYAEALLRNQKFDEARQQYKLFYTNNARSLELKLAGCDSAVLWTSSKSPYTVNSIGSVNSTNSDWGAVYAGKSTLIFTSDRKIDKKAIDNRTGNNWFRLYETDLDSNKTKVLPLIPDNGDDFKNGYHVGPIALNRTADTAYITVTTDIKAKKIPIDEREDNSKQKLYTRRLQLVMAAKRDGEWTVFDSFAYNDVQYYSVGNAALSKNEKLLYFSSDMPGGEGGTDIWYCEKLGNGSWGKPVNCGKAINTKEEDSFPYIDDTGTLYYASKGLPGMGGYDIYSTKGEKTKWSAPKNLKYPINSTSDDFYFVTHDGLSGYLSSNREGGLGSDDIYGFTRQADTITASPVLVATATPPPEPVEPKPEIVISTIYYDLDKSFIRPDAAIELDKLADVLKQHLAIKVQLSSYTDTRASVEYNEALSQRRAKAAVAYLVKRGITADRLMANGYGKTNLVNKCADHVKCTEAEHQLNRRTEFKLIGDLK